MYVKNICPTNHVPTMCKPLPYICPSRVLNCVQSINFLKKRYHFQRPLKVMSFFQIVYILYTRL